MILMHGHLLPIGEVSRRSGLTISALRFYDREGVLPAARVDPATGYRRYDPGQVRQARLLAGMRRVQLPLAEMVAVLDAGGDDETVRDLLDSHVRRLERGLKQARSEVERLASLAAGSTVAVRVGGAELAEALRDVRYAVSQDPDHPALGAVLLEGEGDTDAEVVELDGGHLVSRPFLREALAGVGPRGQLRLPGSMGPLLLANDTGSRLALVMPIRPEI